MGYTDAFHPKGYGFVAILVRNLVSNKVWFMHSVNMFSEEANFYNAFNISLNKGTNY